MINNAFFRSLIAYFVIPNLLFFILSQFIFLLRPPINIDYLLVAFLLPWFANSAWRWFLRAFFVVIFLL